MFYHFSQNNSGGVWCTPAINVIIEADSPQEANDIARDNDLYFDGVDGGMDCECCGDRWYPVSKEEGFNVPSVYGQELGIVHKYSLTPIRWGSEKVPDAIVFFKNGDIQKYDLKCNKETKEEWYEGRQT